MSITLDDVRQASARFLLQEKRGSFYDMSLDLLRRGLEVEGCLLLMATWNFARFRYAVNSFDIVSFTETLDSLHDDFDALSTFTIKDIDFEVHGERIKRIYGALAKWKGIEFTGATKIMQLKCPELFVIWDAYIRGDKPMKRYNELPCVQSGKWKYEYYDTTGEGYLHFLTNMKSRFAHLNYVSDRVTLAKAIDEFNYVNVTLEMQRSENERKAKATSA